MSKDDKRSAPEGIEVRHQRSCGSRAGQRCDCKPTFQAHVWSTRDNSRIRKTFRTIGEAKVWRREAQVALARGTLSAPSKLTLREVAERWLAAAGEGTVRNRSGDVYKPSVLRGYEQALRLRILPDLGALKLSEIRRGDLQDLVDRLVAAGHDPSTVRNTMLPLRVIYRRAANRGEVPVNPTQGLELPAVRGRRERIAAPDEARLLLAALPPDDRAVWATALYSGLRLGELRALAWEHVDLDANVIRVRRAYDPKAGFITPKSRAGTRIVPIARALREHLVAHRLRSSADSELVFPSRTGRPFEPASINKRAQRAWHSAGLQSISMHECRHTFASLMIAAGVNAKALSTFMGHASIQITLDRYGHLFPSVEAALAEQLDAVFAESQTLAPAPNVFQLPR